MRWRAIVLASLLGAILVPAGLSQTRTTAPSIYINVHITLSDSKVVVFPKSAPRGANARLIVRNVGTKPHSFTLVTGVRTGFSRVFEPGKKTVLVLYLDRRGTLTYFSGTSSARARPSMKGTFLIGPPCSQCIQDS